MIKILNTKILLSLAMVAAAAVVIIGATFAFFSDTETSTGNVFAAGEVDLGIDNHSYYNGVLNPETTWRVDYDLSNQPPRQFFNFLDVKPGDWGEDTISLHVRDNDSWLCADVTLTSDNDNGINEPEGLDQDTTGGVGEGELADAINFFWWADDGDNVFETDETLLPAGPIGNLDVGETATVTLADSQNNIWGTPGPFPGDEVKFLAKAWCFGEATMTPYTQDGGNQQSGPDDRPVICDGSELNNSTQTDSFTADISFRAVQSRNNPNFTCDGTEPSPTPTSTPTPSPTPSPTPLACQQADVMLVLDRSGSINSTELAQLKTAANAFVTSLGLTPLGVHAGQTSFATTGTLDQILTANSASLTTSINALVSGGFTNLKSGIDLASTELAGANDRPDLTSPDKMIIITDGVPNRPLPSNTADDVAVTSANAARAAGTEVFVVGVGADVNTAYLDDLIANDPPGHYFSVSDYSGLQTALQELDLCES